jgi:hypothetical protein
MTAPSRDLLRLTGKEDDGGKEQLKIDRQIAK